MFLYSSLNMANHSFTVVVLIIFPFVSCNKYIRIFSDFKNDNDLLFFKNTFPWIVENIGTDISCLFLFKDANGKSGRRQCTLLQLSQNSYLQAEYLSCEANGSTECIKTLPLNNKLFNYCIIKMARYFARIAEKEFKRLKIDITPTIILPRRQIYKNVTPEGLLLKICALYSKWTIPQGCLNPSPTPNNLNANSTIPDETKNTSSVNHTETSTIPSTNADKKEPEDILKVDKDMKSQKANTTVAEKKESKDTLKADKKLQDNSDQNLKNASKEIKPDFKNVEEPNKIQKLQTLESSNQNQGI